MQARPCFLPLMPRKGLGAVHPGDSNAGIRAIPRPHPQRVRVRGKGPGPRTFLFILGHRGASALVLFTSK